MPNMTPDTFRQRVDELTQETTTTTQARIDATRTLCDEYTQATGQTPPERELTRLADWILQDDISDPAKRHARRPVYTDDQLRKRDRRHGQPVALHAGIAADDNRLHAEDVARYVEAQERQATRQRQERSAEGRRRRREETTRRVRQAIEANPGASVEEVAKLTRVSKRTVYRVIEKIESTAEDAQKTC